MTKPSKWLCAQRRPVWASAQSDQSSLSAWRNLGSLATHWAHREDSDQTGQMPRLIWVFAGHTVILLVLSCRGSYGHMVYTHMVRPWLYGLGILIWYDFYYCICFHKTNTWIKNRNDFRQKYFKIEKKTMSLQCFTSFDSSHVTGTKYM